MKSSCLMPAGAPWGARLGLLLLLVFIVGSGAGLLSCVGSPSERVHTVRKGENLYRIGKRYGLRAEVLRQVNDIDDVTTLQVGQRLWIPPSGTRGGAGDRAGRPARAALADRRRNAETTTNQHQYQRVSAIYEMGINDNHTHQKSIQNKEEDE